MQANADTAKMEFLTNYVHDLTVMNMQLTSQLMTYEYIKLFLTVIVILVLIFFIYYYFTCGKGENFMPYMTTLQNEVKRSDPDFDQKKCGLFENQPCLDKNAYEVSGLQQKAWRTNEDFLFDYLEEQDMPYDFDADFYR